MDENYCSWHWLSGQNCKDGPEVAVIRNEEINSFLDWQESLPARWAKAFKICKAFIQRWNKDVR